MRFLTHLVLALLLTGCSALSEEAAPKDGDGGGNDGGGDNGSTNNGDANDGDANNGADDWAKWGTEGPKDTNFDGERRCALDDIRTDDLDGTIETTVPGDAPWDEPVSDDTGRCGDDVETTSWRLMNCERMARELTPFECDLRLVWIGRAHSVDMIDRDYFAHDNPDGESPFDRMSAAGITFSSGAENIAFSATAVEAHSQWMKSQRHRENILSEHVRTGIGIADDDGTLLFTAGFVR